MLEHRMRDSNSIEHYPFTSRFSTPVNVQLAAAILLSQFWPKFQKVRHLREISSVLGVHGSNKGFLIHAASIHAGQWLVKLFPFPQTICFHVSVQPFCEGFSLFCRILGKRFRSASSVGVNKTEASDKTECSSLSNSHVAFLTM